MEVKLEGSHEEFSLHGEENAPKPLMQYLMAWFSLAALNCSLKTSTTSFGDACVALTGKQGWMQRSASKWYGAQLGQFHQG